MQAGIPKNIYNEEFPSDLTLVKDLPKAVRLKGNEIMNVIELLEQLRVTDDVESLLTMFPFVKNTFVAGNDKLPSGFYVKTNEAWIGQNSFVGLPGSAGALPGDRVTIFNKTFEFVLDNGNNFWVEKNSFQPLLAYDLFTALSQDSNTNKVPDSLIDNYGTETFDCKLSIKNVYESEKLGLLPGVISSKTSEIRTNNSYKISNNFTFTSTFYNISREYLDGSQEVINPENISVLMFVRDEFENVKFGIGIDKDYKLHFINGETTVNSGFLIPTNYPVQLTISCQNGKIRIYVDSYLAFETLVENVSNKFLKFSICDDNQFGRYPNGSAFVGEIQLFSEVLNSFEINWNKNYPRTWSTINKETYIDLNFEERIALKEMVTNFIKK